MDDTSLVQHIERETEVTSFPLSVTDAWLEDGNETTGNQFQQPDWQVETTWGLNPISKKMRNSLLHTLYVGWKQVKLAVKYILPIIRWKSASNLLLTMRTWALASSSLRWLCGRSLTPSSSWCPSQATSQSSGSFWLTDAWGLWPITSSSTWPSLTSPWRRSTLSLTLSTRFTTTGTLVWGTAASRTSFRSRPCSHPSTQWLPSLLTGEKSPPACGAGS